MTKKEKQIVADGREKLAAIHSDVVEKLIVLEVMSKSLPWYQFLKRREINRVILVGQRTHKNCHNLMGMSDEDILKNTGLIKLVADAAL